MNALVSFASPWGLSDIQLLYLFDIKISMGSFFQDNKTHFEIFIKKVLILSQPTLPIFMTVEDPPWNELTYRISSGEHPVCLPELKVDRTSQ